MAYIIPRLPLDIDLETKPILKQLNLANKKLAELKGVAMTIPNENILINTLTLQEAKDSSAVENIVTTHDDLYRAGADIKMSISTKEVINYTNALKRGFALVRKDKLLTNFVIKTIQQELEQNNAGFRAVPGTTLKNNLQEVIYTPPQNKADVESMMQNLEQFINDDTLCDLDPLIKMALIHHQFESIHPFYDGNGRTGRIINILYLVNKELLDLPILYLSRYVIQNKNQYYTLLQDVRNNDRWEEWVMFMLKGIEQTATQAITMVKGISQLMAEYKSKIRPEFGHTYKHELLNNLFNHPYTKIEFVMRDLHVSRLTAASHLDRIVRLGLLSKIKLGRTNYYFNTTLIDLFVNSTERASINPSDIIESIHE